MNFEQLLETELAETTEQLEEAMSGTVDAFSRKNKFKAVTAGNDIYVSVSNNIEGSVGTIHITPGGHVEYIDDKGVTLHRDKGTKFKVNTTSLKNYYVPNLLSHAKTDDMFA